MLYYQPKGIEKPMGGAAHGSMSLPLAHEEVMEDVSGHRSSMSLL